MISTQNEKNQRDLEKNKSNGAYAYPESMYFSGISNNMNS